MKLRLWGAKPGFWLLFSGASLAVCAVVFAGPSGLEVDAITSADENCSEYKSSVLCGGDSGSDKLTPNKSKAERIDEVLASCEKMQNCVKEIFGSTNSGIIRDTGAAVVTSTVSLSKKGAWAFGKSANSTKVDEIMIQDSTLGPVLGGLGVSQAVLEIYKAYENFESEQINNEKFLKLNPEWRKIFELLDLSFLQETWANINQILLACDQAVEVFSKSKGTKDINAAKGMIAAQIRETLICALRLDPSYLQHKVLRDWPGCNCDNAGAKGKLIDGVCVSSRSEVNFATMPIDERVPAGMKKFLANLKGRMPGYKIANVDFDGCSFVRVERGPKVKGIANQKNPALDVSDISDHARGTACDLRGVTFMPEGSTNPKDAKVFKMAAGVWPDQDTPYYDLLMKYCRKAKIPTPRKVIDKNTNELKFDPSIGSFYIDMEKRVLAGQKPKGFSDEDFFQVKAGILTRNALRDSGFMVYDTSINSAHHDHFHFEIPKDPGVWHVLDNADSTPEDRETAVANDLDRGAGIIHKPINIDDYISN